MIKKPDKVLCLGQKVLHCHGPSNINLGIVVCSFDVQLPGSVHNHSPLLTMLKFTRAKCVLCDRSATLKIFAKNSSVAHNYVDARRNTGVSA